MIELPAGAELRVTGPRSASNAVVCVNGGQGGEVEGTWSASLEWLVHRLATRFPDIAFGEVKYRVKSWRRLDWCVQDAFEAVHATGGRRTLLVGFSMGGAVAVQAASASGVESVLALAPWFPDRIGFARLRGRRLRVVHGSLDRWLPGIPGVSPDSSRAGFDRARAAGVEGEYTLIPGAVHGIALRAHWGRPVPLPRANTWLRLAADEVERFQAAD